MERMMDETRHYITIFAQVKIYGSVAVSMLSFKNFHLIKTGLIYQHKVFSSPLRNIQQSCDT